MKILVTGGTGFIGSHLIVELLKRGHEVTTLSRSGKFALDVDTESDNLSVVEGNIIDTDLLGKLLLDKELLIHNASAVGAGASILTGADFLNSNIGGTNSLVTVLASGRHKLKHIILGSSISVYGEGNYLCDRCGTVRPPIRTAYEGNWEPNCPHCRGTIIPTATPETAASNGEHLYAVTKKYQEEILSLAAKTIDLPLTIFRYATVFGCGQKPQNPYMEMLRLLLNDSAPVIFEDGAQSRDFIDVSDVVRANLLAMEHYQPGINIYNIGSGHTLSLLAFMHRLINRLEAHSLKKVRAPIISGNLNSGDVRHCNINCGKVRDLLHFSATTTIDTGLDNFVRWYLEERKKNRPELKGSKHRVAP